MSGGFNNNQRRGCVRRLSVQVLIYADLSSTRTARQNAHLRVVFGLCVHVTLTEGLRTLAPRLATRSSREVRPVQMIDMHLLTADDREIILTCITRQSSN